MNTNVYIHEYIDIILQGRPQYFEHMTTGWSRGMAERSMKCFGVWGTFGSTAAWPEVINMWELPGWEGMARNFKIETNHPSMQNPELKKWWDEAQKLRSGGYDRLMVPAPYSPTAAQMAANKRIVGSRVFYHERIDTVPGMARTYLSMLEQEWIPVARELGMELTGAFRTALRNDSECVVIWAIREWEDWADIQIANETSEKVAAWRRKTDGIAIDWMSHCMTSAPASPTHTGKQP